MEHNSNELCELNNFIEEIQYEINECWKLLIISEFNEAMAKLGDIFAYLDKLIKYITQINNKAFNINISEIFNRFVDLEEAMKTKDYILVSDILLYEINPLIGEWGIKISSL